MTSSWLVTDCIRQLEGLLKRKADVVAGASCEDTPGIDSLGESDIKVAGAKLQLWLTKFVQSNSLDQTVNDLIRINGEYEKVAEERKKKHAPSKTDAEANVDDLADDSVGFFIMDTLWKVLCALFRVGEFYRPQTCFRDTEEQRVRLTMFPRELATFCFKHLSFQYSSGIRNQAAQCLGVLSEEYITDVTELFVAKMKLVKKDDDQRDFAPYMAAMRFIKFGLVDAKSDHTRGDVKRIATLSFFSNFNAVAKKHFARGVLRKEACETLREIFFNISSDKLAYERFVMTTQESEKKEYQTLLEGVWDHLWAWSDKAAHKLWAYEAMTALVVANTDVPFFYG